MTDFWTTQDLRRAGFSPNAVQRSITRGKIERLAHGLYIRPGADDLTRLRALCRRWPRIVFTGTTAAHLYGWGPLTWPVSGVIPGTGTGINSHNVRLKRTSIRRSQMQQGLRVVSPVATAHDLVQRWPRAKLISFLERSYGGFDGTARYRSDCSALGPAAQSTMRIIAGRAIIGASSQTERRLAHALAAEGVFTQSNVRVGPYVFDLKVVGQPLLIEVDGQQFHRDTDAFIRDRWKTNAAQRAGYIVLRYSDTCVDYALNDVVAQVSRTARSSSTLLPSDVQGVHRWHRALHSIP
ncbi:type IV toxin-antitoxin system AbiEi family antitoxin domain-containing protein [Corynebacterium sp. zg-331]|uniref:DUF559 domain-containing protein n=1 Tax=unclassified Corynebacterium TaxID=2624378 RepID=UPI00164338AF|nr:type IV toxin-antitoxin system AbiEi family antitoxin domain-containing protein [Corynebacterium sp. zg-331]